MAPNAKPVLLYGKAGPNPAKVGLVLETLGISYEINDTPLSKVKEPEYVAVNPNGRLPTLYDPNTDFKIWESGAIIEYLVDQYDKDHKYSFPAGSKEYYLAKQMLFYQTTGQGPYFGQLVAFIRYHPEKVPSAEERYRKEIDRVTAVLESILEQQKKEFEGKGGNGPWLVGNKLSFADISFIPWQAIINIRFADAPTWTGAKYPLVKDWLLRMNANKQISEAFKKFTDVDMKDIQ